MNVKKKIKKIQEMFQGWFSNSESSYNAFIKAMLRGNVKEMNTYMNEVALATFNSFDTGRHPSGKSQPERFYHGFVLGLLVELRDRYEVKSNRESGYGRYDVMLIPRETPDQAIIKKKKRPQNHFFLSLFSTEFQDPSLLFSELLYVHLPSLSEVL